MTDTQTAPSPAVIAGLIEHLADVLGIDGEVRDCFVRSIAASIAGWDGGAGDKRGREVGNG